MPSVPRVDEPSCRRFSTWRRSAPPRWQAVVSAIERGLPEVLAKQMILVAHSGAGPLLPVVGAHLDANVLAYVFVDATVPPLEGTTAAASSSFLAVYWRAGRERQPAAVVDVVGTRCHGEARSRRHPARRASRPSCRACR